MNIVTDIRSFDCSKTTIASTGTFDGVHTGHRTIINRMTELARQENGKSVIVTFDPHPRQVLDPDNKELKFITTLSEKKELMAGMGVDCMVIIPFTLEFSRMPYDLFVKTILAEKLNTRRMVVGYDHNFGNKRTGNFMLLESLGQQLGFMVEEVQPQLVDGVAVSSTKVRTALSVGDLMAANRYLGYEFMLSGLVVPGNRVGRQIGFPTANIVPGDPGKLTPPNGVYAVRITCKGQQFPGMCNIGVKPTFGTYERSIEVNIFGFNDDIYGEKVTVHFVCRLRDEIKFDSVDKLIVQLEKDKKDALGKLIV